MADNETKTDTGAKMSPKGFFDQSNKTTSFVDKLASGDNKGAGEDFKDALRNKVGDALDASRKDYASSLFNAAKNVMTQTPQTQQLIPVKNDNQVKNDIEQSTYEFEPEEDEILDDLLPKNISTQIYKGFLENSASEQGSRMTAMDNATRNAGELIDSLTLNYNRSRQAQITKELIEVISGAEAV